MNVGKIEATIERVLDGYPLLYHLPCRSGPGQVQWEDAGPEPEPVTIRVGGHEHPGEWWCSGGYLYVRNLDSGVVDRYWTRDITYEGLDGGPHTTMTLVGNNKTWEGRDAGDTHPDQG